MVALYPSFPVEHYLGFFIKNVIDDESLTDPEPALLEAGDVHLRFEGEVLDTIRWRHASDDRSVRPGCCANIEFLRPRAVEPGRYVTHSHIGRLRGDFLPATGFDEGRRRLTGALQRKFLHTVPYEDEQHAPGRQEINQPVVQLRLALQNEGVI